MGGQKGNRERLRHTSSGPIRDFLRHSTADAHAAVDRQLGALLNEGFDGYRAFLLANAAAIFPLEQALTEAGVHRILPEWEMRARAAALRADLASVGASAPRVEETPEIGGEAYQFGMLYVLEGSRLGAKVLARIVSESADPRVRAASRFLHHGEGVRFWQTFLERLENSTAVAAAPEEALAGAHAAFALFASQPAPIIPPSRTHELSDGAR